MKLISWNVNGIRACITKGFKEFLDNNIDNLDSFQTVDEGLNNLIKKNIYNIL